MNNAFIFLLRKNNVNIYCLRKKMYLSIIHDTSNTKRTQNSIHTFYYIQQLINHKQHIKCVVCLHK